MLNSKFKRWVLPALAFTAISWTAGAAEPAVVVIDTDGARQEIALSNLDRVAFGASEVTLQPRDSQEPLRYAYSSVDRIMFNESTSALSALAADGRVVVWPTVTSSSVNIAGAPENTMVNVYGADGATVASATAADGTLSIDLSGVPQGLYVVAVGSQSVKILKK
ncbi:MAG: T9SS type A sorting domain-containing protein [Muribaculaceae bacterium]|nr:T9SS type A sorting domain-containing protein [Muribaculaceae bacterium]